MTLGEPMHTVLVADSASIIQFVLERILTKEGYRVFYTKTPRDFIQQTKTLLPDIIFLQAEIGGGKGYRICQYLQRRPDTRNIPIVLTTRMTDTSKFDFESWPGVVRLLRKPLSSRQVLDSVRSLAVRTQELLDEPLTQADAV